MAARATLMTSASLDALTMPHIDPEMLLTRRQLVEALKDEGYPIALATLETMAVRGGGPPFSKWGRYPLYRWGVAREWAANRLSAPRRSTSEPLRTSP